MMRRLRKKILKKYSTSPAIIKFQIAKSETKEEGNLTFNIKLLNASARKPINSKTHPFLPPFEEGLFVCGIKPEHNLLFNKFPIHDHHLLVTTKEFCRQEEGISKGDFEASMFVIEAMNGIGYFNCGSDSGASQPHRHLQIVRREELDELPILTEIDKMSSSRITGQSSNYTTYPDFNFKHKLIFWDESEEFKENAASAELAYRNCLMSLNIKAGVSYNVLFTNNWLLLIPRKNCSKNEKYSLNSMFFLGSVIARNNEEFELFNNISISELMRELCFD